MRQNRPVETDRTAKIVGLTGLIGSGKSTVSAILGQNGAYVIDADEISHDVILRGNPAYGEIIGVFGEGILNDEGEIDRKSLGGIVFSDRKLLDTLTKIVHKYVIIECNRLINENKGNYDIIVLDAPLLIEANLHTVCDETWLVDASREARKERIMARDGLGETEAEARINARAGIEALLPYVDRIIENNGTPESLKEHITKTL